MTDFVTGERIAQAAYFATRLPSGVAGHGGSGYRLQPRHKALNIASSIRTDAATYFDNYGIAWHQHANHGLSSQASCLNFLMPLATRPKLLARVIGVALDIPPPTMLKVESGPDNRPWFIGFEWIGRNDYLNEGGTSGVRKRGARVTSADAVVRFEHEGRTETALIEWKYTENETGRTEAKRNEERLRRYKNLVFAPSGPIRADLGLTVKDFFWKPFYQLLRHHMLAFRMQAAREDGAERVRVLHISPSSNHALHKVTAPAMHSRGNDAFKVFRGLLVRPEDFTSRSTEDVFGKVLSEADGEDRAWADYLRDRYSFMSVA